MRPIPVLAGCVVLSLAFTVCAQSVPKAPASPVVVELFTSEGCSDCPPADDLLNAMAQHRPGDVDVIPLAFHVTYWDTYGWRDRFSDIHYTERQKEYQTHFHIPAVYTPQSVIDGRYETVGNDEPKVEALIRRAASDPLPVKVSVSPMGKSLNVTAAAAPAISGAVLLAITEDDLTTKVGAGENRSRTLHHSGVVRSLENVGRINNGAFSRTVPLKLHRDWNRNQLHAVVLVQDSAGHVIGAATVSLAGRVEQVRVEHAQLPPA